MKRNNKDDNNYEKCKKRLEKLFDDDDKDKGKDEALRDP